MVLSVSVWTKGKTSERIASDGNKKLVTQDYLQPSGASELTGEFTKFTMTSSVYNDLTPPPPPSISLVSIQKLTEGYDT